MTSKHSVPSGFRAVGSRRRILSTIPVAIIAACVVALAPSLPSGAAQAPIDLHTAGSFAVLAGQGITNANATTIWGDVGSYPNPAQTGFNTVTMHGTNHATADAVTQQAKDDLTTAYDDAAGSGPATDVATELGGTTLTPGVYNHGTLEITGTLTLDTQGDPYAVFIFQSGATLVTASNSNVTVLNGGIACNVFWQVPTSATLGTGSHLIGTVLASTSIQAQSGATIQGRLLAGTASVTLDNNTITDQVCANAVTTTTAGGPATSTTTAAGGPATTSAPSLVAPSTPSSGGQTASTPTTGPASGVTTTTSETGIPGLPVTGSDPRLPIAGVLAVGIGASILRLSNTRRRRGSSSC
jgi:hypothetical protein